MRAVSRQPIPADARRVFSGEVFEIYQWEQRQFDGSSVTFEKAQRPDTAHVLPVSGSRVAIARQQQPGATPVYGPLGGRIGPGESPEEAARRELAEEAGLAVGRLQFWWSWQPLTKVDWAVYLFIARDCAPLPRHADPGERIELLWVDIDELLRLAATDEFAPEVALPLLREAHHAVGMRQMRDLLFPRSEGAGR